VRPLHSLLIVYLGPPLMAAALLLFTVSWFSDQPSDTRPDAASAVRKGGRLGSQSEMFRWSGGRYATIVSEKNEKGRQVGPGDPSPAGRCSIQRGQNTSSGCFR